MGIKCGIVGLPNVGKSTLFNALTKAGIAAANFPFCTIEPNVGVVPVPDPRLERWPKSSSRRRSSRPRWSSSTSPAWSPARPGRGPGQQVPRPHPRGRRHRPRGALLRARPDIIHVNGKVDPIADIETIDTELALADLDRWKRR
jgi:ribosome-binding ATPase YchF (GTP1/OBG family)